MATPQDIQRAMKQSKAAGDEQATAQLRAMLKQAYEQEAEGAATEGMGLIEKLGTGLTSGFDEAGRGFANMLPESLQPSWATDEAYQERLDLNEQLKSTGAGMAGNLIGSLAATAPIGGGAGSLALKAGSKLPGALKALTTGGKIRRGATYGGAQGATEGAILASPDSKAGGAGVGLAFGTGMPLIARSLGAITRKFGKGFDFAKHSDEAEEFVEEMRKSGVAEPFVPLSHALPEGSILRQIYQGIFANIPGNKIRPQHGEAMNDFRQSAIHHAVPDGVEASVIFEAGDSAQDGFRRLNTAWDDVWKPVNEADIMIPKNIIPDDLAKQARKMSGGMFEVPQPGLGKGQSLTYLSDDLQTLANMAKESMGRGVAKKFIIQKNRIDEILAKSLPEEQAALWRANKNKFSLFKDLEAGAKGKMGSAEFTPPAVSQATAKRFGKVGGDPENPIQRLSQLGEKVLPEFPSKAGIFQTGAALGAATLLGGGAYALADDYPKLKATIAFLAPFMATKMASRPGFQKALTEGFKRAKKTGVGLDEYKSILERMGFTSRQIAVGLTVKE